MYKVLKYFTDLQDNRHPYHEGDIFPREGLKVSNARLEELSGSNNKQGKPLIEKIKDDFFKHMNPQKEYGSVEYTKTEINRMSTADLRKLAKDKEISGAEEMTGAELKKVLIEKLGL